MKRRGQFKDTQDPTAATFRMEYDEWQTIVVIPKAEWNALLEWMKVSGLELEQVIKGKQNDKQAVVQSVVEKESPERDHDAPRGIGIVERRT